MKRDWIKTLNPRIYNITAPSSKWTDEQWEERERIMRESDMPLAGTDVPGGYIGYVGSREMIADMMAASYYERLASWNQFLIELDEE